MITKSNFKPAWWLKNSHLQTMWGTATRRNHKLDLQRERIELPDGDFIDIDWAIPPNYKPYHAPTVLVLHGLGGSIDSHYARGIMSGIRNQGWRGVFMHFRGASGEPNRLSRSYHSGDTNDVEYLVNFLLNREPNTHLVAVGFSLGGNVLLKWLGETGNKNQLRAAVAISVPFELYKVANRLQSGFSRFYQNWLLRELRDVFLTKFATVPTSINVNNINKCRTFWEFDNTVTAPLHGFKDAADYYQRASSRQFLKSIAVPTLIVHATDDPFMTPDCVPTEAELSEEIILEISPYGGHVGFITGDIPGWGEYWLEKRVIEYLSTTLKG
jgi:hypothetical protein